MFFLRSQSAETVSTVVVLVGSLIATGCVEEPSGPRLLLAASIEHVGAEVVIDGEKIGNLKRQGLAARLFDKFLPRPDFFRGEVVSLSVDVSHLSEGQHVVRVVKGQKELVSHDFSVPLSEDVLVFVEFSPRESQMNHRCQEKRIGARL